MGRRTRRWSVSSPPSPISRRPRTGRPKQARGAGPLPHEQRPPSAPANEIGRVAVDLGPRSYDILVGGGLIARAGSLIAPRLKDRRALIVTDATVARFYLDELVRSLEAAGIRQEA